MSKQTNALEVMNNASQRTLTSAMSQVLGLLDNHGLSPQFWNEAEESLSFLSDKLGITPEQALLVTAMMETGEEMTWSSLSKFFRCNRLVTMQLAPGMTDLVKWQWVRRQTTDRGGDSFILLPDVESAIIKNQKYEPEDMTGWSVERILEKLFTFIRVRPSRLPNRGIETDNVEHWLMHACESNPHLPLCHKALQYSDDRDSVLLLFIMAHNYIYTLPDEDGLSTDRIDNFYTNDISEMLDALECGNHPFLHEKLLDYKCENGVCNKDVFVTSQRFRDELLYGIEPHLRSRHNLREVRGLTKASSIPEKQMFYNAPEQKQIEQLTELLSGDRLAKVQERMKQKGWRKGFACLFHGGPGTGKTETVLQLTRRTGRDVMLVDIASMRDKFVGESEKNIKAVFRRYRDACTNSQTMPILFFNEADALFNKRNEHSERSVDKMENAMQNIILQEMENLDGILIATTNLISNLDDAFDRRFIFKIQFDQPSVEVKAKLWRTMLDDEISQQEAETLALRYDMSGGQIENVARKRAVDFILKGTVSSFSELDEYCKQEFLSKKGRRHNTIGF